MSKLCGIRIEIWSYYEKKTEGFQKNTLANITTFASVFKIISRKDTNSTIRLITLQALALSVKTLLKTWLRTF